MIQPNCTTRCTCRGGYFDCKSQKCLLDGPTCYASGDPHYGSFDSKKFDFQGNCEYVLTKPCNNSDFIITAVNILWEYNPTVSVTSLVKVIIPNKGLEIILSRSNISINNIVHINNGDRIIHRSSGVEVSRIGGRPYVLLTIGYPLAIKWDGYWRVDITISSSWQGQLCGLCGNYNNDVSDDFMFPNGSVTASVNDFGSSWLYAKPLEDCGIPPPPPPCPASVTIVAQSRCNELMNSVFNVCSNVVDSSAYIDDCKLDYCLCHKTEREDCYCNSLSSYVTTCASKGVIIPNWRNFFCRKYCVNHTEGTVFCFFFSILAIICPSNMVYQQCGPSCPQTCDTNEDTDCSGGCVEGCFCPSGQVLSNGKCINETECEGMYANTISYLSDYIQLYTHYPCIC